MTQAMPAPAMMVRVKARKAVRAVLGEGVSMGTEADFATLCQARFGDLTADIYAYLATPVSRRTWCRKYSYVPGSAGRRSASTPTSWPGSAGSPGTSAPANTAACRGTSLRSPAAGRPETLPRRPQLGSTWEPRFDCCISSSAGRRYRVTSPTCQSRTSHTTSGAR